MINRSVSVSVSAPPSGPAFWAARGVPASREQRGRAGTMAYLRLI